MEMDCTQRPTAEVSPVVSSMRAAAAALQSGAWLISRADMKAAAVVWEQLWMPFQDALKAEEPDASRVRERLAAVPSACAAACEVPSVDARFVELLELLPPAIAAARQDRAVDLLGQAGTIFFAIGNGPEVWT